MTEHIATIADADSEAFEDEIIPEASHLATALIWAFALIALIVLPLATVPGKRDLGWVQEPWSWPFITLVVGLIGGFGPLRAYVTARREPGFAAKANLAFDGMGRSLIYAAGFLAYVGGVSVLGLHHRLGDLHAGASLHLGPARHALGDDRLCRGPCHRHGVSGWAWDLVPFAPFDATFP